jgi:hypothetical protein
MANTLAAHPNLCGPDSWGKVVLPPSERMESDGEAYDFLNGVDFSQLINRFVVKARNHGGLGWTTEKADSVAQKYKLWFYLKRLFPKEALPPTPDIASFWQAHIQDSVAYFNFCSAITGHYIHHTPYLTFLETSATQQQNLLAKTTARFKEVYGEDL